MYERSMYFYFVDCGLTQSYFQFASYFKFIASMPIEKSRPIIKLRVIYWSGRLRVRLNILTAICEFKFDDGLSISEFCNFSHKSS